jgi:pimeloyl-ACP methyl ester carboxylesterase
MDAILEPLPMIRSEVDAIFIYGTKSDYILPEDFDSIKEIFPLAKFAELPAGHWLHAEDPEGFYKKVMEFVTKGNPAP